MTLPDDNVSWDLVGPVLGAGEYGWRLYGPREGTAWRLLRESATFGASPEAVGQDVVAAHAATLADLERWHIKVYIDTDTETSPILLGTWVDPRLSRADYPGVSAYESVIAKEQG